MKNKGFSLVELMVVVAIVAVLVGVASIKFSDMQQKTAIDGQIKAMYADVMNARVQSLYTKRSRSLVISGKTFRFYSSNVTTVSPESQKTFAYPMTTNLSDGEIMFATTGLVNTPGSVCIVPSGDTSNAIPGTMDSLVISSTNVNFGKRREGGLCAADTIDKKF